MDCELMCYDWGREHGIDVMSCIPEHAVGPLLCEAHDTTYQHLLGSILLGQFNESHRWGITDVRDCAEGYRLIAESETVKTGDRFFTITVSQRHLPPYFLGHFSPVLRRFFAALLRFPASWRQDGENGRKMA